MGEEVKSALDGVPVQDKAFPLSELRQQFEQLKKPAKTIVGACKHCGSPIYGYSLLLDGNTPETTFSCDCYRPTRKVQQEFLKNKEEGMVQEGK